VAGDSANLGATRKRYDERGEIQRGGQRRDLLLPLKLGGLVSDG